MKITINKCEGYVWKSNANEPKIYEGKPADITLDENKNPFIIEAQLCDTEHKVSYSVKYVDGKYIVAKHDFKDSDFNSSTVTRKEFVGHRMKGHDLQFLRYWIEEEDANCMNIPVLRPTHLVFTGFTTKETNK